VLAEALVIAGAASLAAVAVAYAGLRALSPLMTRLPRAEELAIDFRVLAAALLLGCTSALLFGLLPALRPIRAVRSPSTPKSQGLLVAAEVALAFVLLMGAGLLLRTFAAIRATNLGYNPSNVLTHFLALDASADGTRTAGAALYSRIRERLRALPGVRAVSTASALPMFGVQIQMDVHPAGEPERHHEQTSSLAVISEDYFRAMEIPLRAGRGFDRTDRDGSPRVAVVSESIAGRYFGGKPVGRRIVLPEFLFNIDGGKDVSPEIVGVVGSVCQSSIEDCQAEHIYLPESQNALRMENLLVRTEGDPMAAENAIRKAMRVEAPSIPLDEAQTLAGRTSYLIDVPRRAMWLLGVFAGLALLLAAAGIYSVSAYLAARRSREIGIRMALGAGFADIATLVYRGVLAPSALGLAVGMGAALWLTRFAQSLLFGVRANDPKTLLLAAAVLLAIPVLAAAIPALRAASTDPATVLRRD
jgi:predicted permease